MSMSYIKNIEPGINKLEDIISIKRFQVISKALVNNDNTDIRFFSLSKGETIRNETYPMDTLILCLNGVLKAIEEGEEYVLHEKELKLIEMGRVSSLEAIEDTIMLQIMVKETKDE